MDSPSVHASECRELFDALWTLREAVAQEGREQLESWDPRLVRGEYGVSALNLAHYLALRRRDLVGLQEQLMVLGLSSLGRCESRVLANLDAVLDTLAWKAGCAVPSHIAAPTPEEFFLGTRLLQKHTTALFGARRRERSISIMATMAGDLADDYEGVLALARAGVDIARINCSKDSGVAGHRCQRAPRKSRLRAPDEGRVRPLRSPLANGRGVVAAVPPRQDRGSDSTRQRAADPS